MVCKAIGGSGAGGVERVAGLAGPFVIWRNMDPNTLMMYEIAAAIHSLAAATYYLTWAIATLAVVGLVGYWCALHAARPKGE